MSKSNLELDIDQEFYRKLARQKLSEVSEAKSRFDITDRTIDLFEYKLHLSLYKSNFRKNTDKTEFIVLSNIYSIFVGDLIPKDIPIDTADGSIDRYITRKMNELESLLPAEEYVNQQKKVLSTPGEVQQLLSGLEKIAFQRNQNDGSWDNYALPLVISQTYSSLKKVSFADDAAYQLLAIVFHLDEEPEFGQDKFYAFASAVNNIAYNPDTRQRALRIYKGLLRQIVDQKVTSGKK
ncbi:MAG: hypothetical protein KKF44_07355 [Nanoarchaeota archaeon]|nr:hypothetical protein [Nanoarchaeota archaeon]